MGAFVKQLVSPVQGEVAALERFLNTTIYGRLQYMGGANDSLVRKALFYYDAALPQASEYYDPTIDHAGTWDYAESHRVDRAYDYPHVTIAWWSLYRLARYHSGATTGTWEYFLNGAYKTIIAMFTTTDTFNTAFYTQFGLMEGSVFETVLLDLQREGLTDQANDVESRMKKRTDTWNTEANPFGSEMPWDSTGQEEVYTWLRHFGSYAKADYTVETVVAIQSLLPHWTYSGANRRYWDMLYSASVKRVERMGMHYESGLSAIPLLDSFRRHPTDVHLLQIAFAGLDGALTTIQSSGAPSTAFHTENDFLNWDSYSGDSALGAFGHLFSSGSYVIDNSTFGGLHGWNAETQVSGDVVTVTPTDSVRQRMFVAPLGLYVTLDAGTICQLSYNQNTNSDVQLTLCERSDSADLTPNAFVRIEQGNFAVQGGTPFSGATQFPLSTTQTTVTIVPSS